MHLQTLKHLIKNLQLLFALFFGLLTAAFLYSRLGPVPFTPVLAVANNVTPPSIPLRNFFKALFHPQCFQIDNFGLSNFGVEWESDPSWIQHEDKIGSFEWLQNWFYVSKKLFGCVLAHEFNKGAPTHAKRMFPELKKLNFYEKLSNKSCWNVKFEPVGSGHELTTPILNASEDSYEAVKEVMNRYARRNVGYNTKIDAVHVHVSFPNRGDHNQIKLLWLFAKIEPVLTMLNTRKMQFTVASEMEHFKNFNEILFDEPINSQYYGSWGSWSYPRLPKGINGYYLNNMTGYGTAEFRSIIDLTWDPEINVQNIILSQTIVKIANLPPEEFLQIIDKIDRELPFEIFQKLPKPTGKQVETILKILENVAKKDAFFQQSKTQPNFGIFDQKKL